MFGHLDDTTPPDPTFQTLGSVLARSARLRRRRAVSGASAAAVIAFALGIALAGTLSRTSVPANADFSSQGGVAPGAAVPVSSVLDPVFVSLGYGLALAPHGVQTALVRTTDGGRTWRIVSGDLPGRFPDQLQFGDAEHGLLWGGAPGDDGGLPLWVTSDGGRDWTEAPIGPAVMDVSAIGPDVWAVTGTCFLGTNMVTDSCPVTLEVSRDAGRTWSPSSGTPPVAASTGLSLSAQDVELARISLQHAYVLSFDPTGSLHSGQLVYTPDGGSTWESRTDPCPRHFDLGEELAGSSSDDLWMLCGSQGTAQVQAKALYRSFDGGRSWALTAAANTAALSGGLALSAGGGMPVNGYVSPYSLGHHNFAVVSATTAWLFPEGGRAFQTTDGGRSWRPLEALTRSGFAVGGSGNVTFVDDTHGWISEAALGLWRTSDGHSWTRLGP